MWQGKKVSVIFPTYNEKDSIKDAIGHFFETGYVDEVVVVNNNARPGTAEEVSKTKARQVFEKRQGYGYALRRGFEEATGDLIITAEPDGTFDGKDILKLLAYSDDFDTVWGTRTNIALIAHGANMGFGMRLGNVLVAKLVQNLFNTSRLTDVGCTLKLFKKEVISKLKGQFTVGGQQFGPELMILCVINDFKLVEIPVYYGRRVGTSSVTGNRRLTIFLALNMIFLIFRYFLKRPFVKGRGGR